MYLVVTQKSYIANCESEKGDWNLSVRSLRNFFTDLLDIIFPAFAIAHHTSWNKSCRMKQHLHLLCNCRHPSN